MASAIAQHLDQFQADRSKYQMTQPDPFQSFHPNEQLDMQPRTFPPSSCQLIHEPNHLSRFPFCAFLAVNHRLSKEHS